MDIKCQVDSTPFLSQIIANKRVRRTGIFKHEDEQVTKNHRACDQNQYHERDISNSTTTEKNEDLKKQS